MIVVIDFIYDEETYRNLFSAGFINADSGEYFSFEVSPRRNEWAMLVRFIEDLKTDGDRMFGFNNIFFDYPVLHELLVNYPAATDARTIYRNAFLKANKIINTEFEDRFSNVIWDNDRIVKQGDLFLIHHFDNAAKQTSLKALEFAMRSHNLVDLPYPPETELTDDQIQHVMDYMRNDVGETHKFYLESLEQIRFREQLNEKFEGLDFTNFNDTKIGKQVFINTLENELGSGICFYKDGGSRKPRQTIRKQIALADVVLPVVEFRSPQFKAVYDWMIEQVITETKGVFTEIEEHNLGELAQYAELYTKKQKFKAEPTQAELDKFYKEHPAGWVEQRPLAAGGVSHWKMWRIATSLNVLKDGVQFVFGTGGLHASIESTTVVADDDYEIIDFDVTSYYPSLAIVNRLYPKHLTEKFCDIYADMKEQRTSYPKGSAENAMLKLALNGTYGETNNKYSPFFDPQFTMSITVNGQLLLCMLVEELLMEVPGLSIVQANTDGITVKVPRKEKIKNRMYQITADWQKRTGLELEEAHYQRMFIRDVNGYIAQYTNGKTKMKGPYAIERAWHQNHSALVVPKAVEAHLIHGKDVETFIRNHDDPFDFYILGKVPRSSRMVLRDADDTEVQTQNTTRYYVSTDGKTMFKVMPPLKGKTEDRYFNQQSGWLVTEANRVDGSMPTNINYDYYINEAMKLIEPVRGE